MFLALALAVALFFRLFGLSHDLHLGNTYHPDTPKQIAAVERFLDGVYYKHFGLSDYDGYPLFNSHLVEYVVRLAMPVVNGAASLLGIPYHADDPGKIALFWITRLWNVLLSTLLVFVVYRMGRENFSLGAGVLAAWFLAVSPADMTCAHFETGDTAAGFFATLCMYFAMRIYNRGSSMDYVFAAVAGMFAFASKYNAGIAMLAPVAAHVLRQRRWFDVFEAEEIAKLVLFGIASVAGVLVAIPSLLTHPSETVREIVQFFHHVSSGRRLPGEIKEGGLWARFLFSMSRNGPVLVTILSPCLAAISVLGLGHVFRWNRRMVILYSLPLVYFLLGVSLRPLSHPVYHTMMTPTLFVICAAIVFQLYAVKGRWGRPAAIGSIAIVACSLAGLANESAEESFYYWHRDTRLLAQAWTRENVPTSFAKLPTPYGFDVEEYGNPAGGPFGVLFVWNSIRSRAPFEQMFLLKNFDLEDDPLPFFRNPDLRIHAWSDALHRDFRMPVVQRMPSRTGNEILFGGGAEFWRSESVFHVKKDRVLRRVLVYTQALERAELVLRNGALPNRVLVSFGGTEEVLSLRAGEARVLTVDQPKRSFPCEEGQVVYRLELASEYGQVRVTLAVSDVDRATALFSAGLYKDAYPLLVASARAQNHPTLAAHALIAALLGGVEPTDAERAELAGLVRVFDEPWTADRVLEVYGIHPDYLAALEYIVKEAEDQPSIQFSREADGLASGGFAMAVTNPAASRPVLGVPGIILEPGAYRMSFGLRPKSKGEVLARIDLGVAASADVALDGPAKARVVGGGLDVRLSDPCVFEAVTVPVQVPYGVGELSAACAVRAQAPVSVDAVRVRPDVVETLNALGRVLRLMDGRAPPEEARDLLAYEPLLALGDRARAAGDVTRAFVCYAAAAQLAPGLVAPLERAESVRDRLLPGPRDAARELTRMYRRTRDSRTWRPADVLFANGVRLTGYRIQEQALNRGDTFGLNFYWSLEEPGIEPRALAAWVHVINSDGDMLLQADRTLSDDLAMNPGMEEREPLFIHVDVPKKCRLGEYRIEMGLYDPDTGKRIKVKSTEFKTRGKGVILPEGIEVVL